MKKVLPIFLFTLIAITTNAQFFFGPQAGIGVATGAESGDEQEEGDACGVCFHKIEDG